MKGALATIVFLLLSMAAFGQSSNQKVYRIRPDDILRIQVYGEAQVNVEVPVGEDGNISAPFVGTLRAEGRTPAELEAELTKAYQDRLRLRDPKVSVTFARYRPSRASIGGAVARPGQYDFRPGDTLLSLIHQGGDPIEGAADQHRAVLHRKDSDEAIPIDLYGMLRRGDLSQNYELQDGDQLEVPVDNRNQVKVLGFVQKPGLFAFREPMTLADALSQAGGEIPTRSMMSRVMIQREMPGAPGTFLQIRADFVRYEHGDPSQNVQLQPNDFIYVPATNTPDINTIANIVNAVFYVQNVLKGGIFGLKLFH